jgi:hypothetical protein
MQAAYFTVNLRATARRGPRIPAMDWLVDTIELFGLRAQNWMLVVAAMVLAYIAVLVIARMGQRVQ